MKNNENIKALNKINPKAFRALHNEIGFDFEKPFALFRIDGNFTVRKLENLIDEAGMNSRKDAIAILIHEPRSTWNKDLRLVTLEKGKINTDIRPRGLGNFWRKSDFEEMRKSRNAETFVIVQSRLFFDAPKEKPIDLNGRFKTAPHRRTWNGFRATSSTYTIDKSGYIVDIRKENLKRRADDLRKERAKNAYLLTDNTAKVEELRRKISIRKAEIVNDLISATDAKSIKNVASKLDWGGLYSVMSLFEDYERLTNTRGYSSIESSERAYNTILEKLGA